MSIRYHLNRPDYEFILLFNRATGSDRIYYFMVDPRTKDNIFPKMNTTIFYKLRNLVGYRPIALNGMLYIVGGKYWTSGEVTGCTWRYNPDTGKWSACKSMLEPRCRFTADVLDGKIVVTGGEVRGGKVCGDVEWYDPGTDTWTAVAKLPRPRVDHASCVVGGTRLYVSGGISNLKHQCSNIFWVYDILTNEWTDPCPSIILPHEREKHLMVPIKNSIFVMAGRGFDQEIFQEKDEGHMCSYSTKNDGETNKHRQWDLEHPTMFHTRVNPASVPLGRRIYLFGGKSFQKDREVTEVDFYNTKTRKWRTAFNLPSRYSYANMDSVKITESAKEKSRMSSNARFKRGSYCETNLHSEMKTWRRNKIEDRKLALQNEVVDKNKASMRKTYQQEKHFVNKEFDDRFTKTTPSADEYLEKSQAKYSTWKERERERLDRRYSSLHKSYMEAIRKLGIKNYAIPKQRKTSKSKDTPDGEPETKTDKDTEEEVSPVEDESMSEEDALLALEKLNVEISRRRFSEIELGSKHPRSKRRGSTGSMDLAEFSKLRSLHLALTTVAEGEQDFEDSEEEREDSDKVEELNDLTTKHEPDIDRDGPIDDVTVDDLVVKPKRRASIATIPKPAVKDSPIPLGKRFDRRPTLPNVAIPFNYGN